MKHLRLIDIAPGNFRVSQKLGRVPPYRVNSVKNVAEVRNGERRGRPPPPSCLAVFDPRCTVRGEMLENRTWDKKLNL